jgi:hypothetical protein
MLEVKGHTVDTWCIMRKSDNSVIHYDYVPIGSQMQSGLDIKQTFETEIEWANKLLIYNITAETSSNIVLNEAGNMWIQA